MIGNIDLQQIYLLIILIGAFILLITNKIRIDLTAILIIVALSLTRILEPAEALSGFSSEPAIVIAAIFVLSGGLYQTGLSNQIGRWIGRVASGGYARMLIAVMPTVAALSAFTHHVTITAVMLPVILKLSRDRGIAPSKLLMPMSFAASLGTTITIVGAPAFLIADSLLRQAGRQGLSIFSIAPIGIILSLAGTLFTLILGRFLLPDHPGDEGSQEHLRLEGYYTELVVLPDSPFINQTIPEIEEDENHQFRIVNWIRQGRPRQRPYTRKRIKEGDVLVIQTSPEEIATIESKPGVAFNAAIKAKDDIPPSNGNGEDASERLVQAVVAPGSDLDGRVIGRTDLQTKYKVLVVGIWRQKGWLRTELSRVRLRAGDVLVLMGDKISFNQVARDHSFLMLVPFQGEPQLRHKAPIAGAIMMASILVVASNLVSVETGFLAGAAGMVLSGCIPVRKAYQSIDTRIFVFIAGAIPLGLAMQKSGTAALVAGFLQRTVHNWSQISVLLILFLSAAIITQIMSDAATTALLGPVAIALARALGHAPEAYVVTVAMASVASFFTPIGHHGNLLIYGPGRYRFKDFLIVGTPLTLLVGTLIIFMAPMLWPN